MRIKFILLTLLTSVLYTCGQSSKPRPTEVDTELGEVDLENVKKFKTLTFDPKLYTESESKNIDSFIDTQFKYTNAIGENVIIQNSFPKGGGDLDGIRGYYDSSGTHYGYGIFWTRLINETTTPLDFSINFPAELFAIFNAQDAYFKLFLPPNTMTDEQLPLYNYGITGLKYFLDFNFNKPTVFTRTLNPNEECLFLVGLLIHVPQQNGPIRAGLVPNEQGLFYRISIDPIGSVLIPCGQFVFRK